MFTNTKIYIHRADLLALARAAGHDVPDDVDIYAQDAEGELREPLCSGVTLSFTPKAKKPTKRKRGKA